MEKENLRNEENKELDEEFDDEEFDDEDDIGFIGTESDLDVCTEDSIINDCVDEVLKNGSVSEEKEKTERGAETDLLTAPETEDVNKEEPNEEHDKPVSKRNLLFFKNGFTNLMFIILPMFLLFPVLTWKKPILLFLKNPEKKQKKTQVLRNRVKRSL